ncbi:YcxB family protein [Chamaesiphon minutus]|uniref:YcxB family protein n=1 Tax=Chamaesiphon minutus TaxID=1173032 RepID=UPI0012F81C47|nr:YcxB family protein [Chamaesiphon minutus]
MNDLQEASDVSSIYSPVKVVKSVKNILIAYGILFLIFILILLSKGNGVPPKAWTVLVFNFLILSVASCAVACILVLQNRFLVKRAWNNSTDDFKHEICVETNEIGIKIITARSESIMQYSVYTYWQETSSLFIIYYQDGSLYNIIPKTAFSDEDRVSEFRQLLIANIPSKRKKG